MINKKRIVNLFALDSLLRFIFFFIALVREYEYEPEHDGKTDATTFLLFAILVIETFVLDCVVFVLFNKFFNNKILMYVFRTLISLFTVTISFLLSTTNYAHWDLSKIGSYDLQLMRNTMIVSTISSLLSIVVIKK